MKRNGSDTPRNRRAGAAIYRAAAKRISECDYGAFSCVTISQAGGDSEDYAKLFRPSEKEDSALWGMGWSEDIKNWRQRNNCRIIALCFMAAMVEAGDA